MTQNDQSRTSPLSLIRSMLINSCEQLSYFSHCCDLQLWRLPRRRHAKKYLRRHRSRPVDRSVSKRRSVAGQRIWCLQWRISGSASMERTSKKLPWPIRLVLLAKKKEKRSGGGNLVGHSNQRCLDATQCRVDASILTKLASWLLADEYSFAVQGVSNVDDKLYPKFVSNYYSKKKKSLSATEAELLKHVRQRTSWFEFD